MTTTNPEAATNTLTPTAASDLFRSAPTEFIKVDGAEVAYRSVGTGPDVLFVHGWPVSGATFRDLLPHLAQHVSCHVIDLPGAGSSRFDSDSPLSMDHHIDSVRRVIDHLGVDEIALVGQDSGGMIARHVSLDEPRVRALGLINTEPPKPGWRFLSFVATRNVPGFKQALGWLAGQARLRQLRIVFGDVFVDSSLLNGEFDEFFLEPLNTDDDMLNAASTVLKSLDVAKHLNSLASLHPQLDVPVQLVWGDQDPFFPVQQARDMVATFPDAQLTEIKGAGLFCHEEAPEAVAAALLPTLTGTR